MDFSNIKFSFASNEPDFLPNRLRLPSGDTRYSYDISLEEVYSLGYTGPYNLPDVLSTQIVEWNSDSLDYTIRDKTQEELKIYSDHLDALSYIELSLLEESSFIENIDNLTEEYIKFKFEYFKKLKELKEVSYSLTVQTVKNIEINLWSAQTYKLFATKEELEKAYTAYFSGEQERLRYEYEKYGLVRIEPIFQKFFTVDSSWVLGSEPYPWPTDEHFLNFYLAVNYNLL